MSLDKAAIFGNVIMYDIENIAMSKHLDSQPNCTVYANQL